MRGAHLQHVLLAGRTLQKRLFSSASYVQPRQGFVSATLRAPRLPACLPHTLSLPKHHRSSTIASWAKAFATYPEMDRSGQPRSKRKHSANTNLDRPSKQLKPEAASIPNGEEPLQNGAVYGMDSDEDDTRLLPLVAATADTPEWQATIEKVVKSVVSIHFCQTCSFDTDPAISSEATGFVVDAERGYILTNRHVVCAGPFWGYCVFDNHEECDVYPCYVDCVHDFGRRSTAMFLDQHLLRSLSQQVSFASTQKP